MKKLLLFIAILISTMGLFAQNVGNETIIDYEGYSLKFTVTNVEPAECKVLCSTRPTSSTEIVIPSSVIIEGTEFSVTSIGYMAFYSCSNLTSINIPNSVTSIGYIAFYSCSNLTSINIPNSVTSIGDRAFSSCDNLTSITVEEGNPVYDSRNNCNAIIETETNTLIAGCQNTVIPNSVTSIGNYALYYCSNLTSIEIPNSVTSIGDFSGCSSLTSIVVESGNTVYDSRDNCNAIIETATNTLIAGCQNTVIPNSVTSIGNYAFYSCSNLTSIEIPNSVTSIGDEAFYGCSSLTSIDFGENSQLTSIGDYAFEYCDNLTSIEIPNSVTSIGNSAFYECYNLTSITVEEGNPVYDSRNNCNAIIETETNTLIAGCQNTLIPNSVTSIGYMAFYLCSNLTSIEIPNSVTSIGYDAFRGCTSLTSIYCYAENVPETDNSAFNYCSSDMTIYVPAKSVDAYKAASPWNNYTILAMPDKIEDYESYSLHYIITNEEPAECEVICGTHPTVPTEIAIPSTVIISEQTEQTEVVIGAEGSSSNQYIPTYEYYNYSVTQQIYTADEIQSGEGTITSVAFRQTGSVGVTRKLDVYMLNTDKTSFVSNTDWFAISSGNLVFSGTVSYPAVAGKWLELEFQTPFEYEGDNVVFCVVDKTGSYTSSEKFDSFNTGTNRAMYVYRDSSPYDLGNLPSGNMISDVNVVKFVTTEGKLYTVTSIGNSAFSECENLTSIEIPNSVVSIGDRAFQSCSNLTSIEIPNSVTSMGNMVFWNCSNLTSIEIPNSVTSIGGYAFSGCSNLTSIEIPNSVTSIGNDAFSDCINLTSIEIPNSVTSIGYGAFLHCSSLTSIEIPNSVTSIGEAAFSRCFNLTNITVENGNPVYDSRNDCNAIIETSTNILINGCMNTIIPDNITTIGFGAFAECTLLTSIEIPNTVTSIEYMAFYSCSNLTSIEIPNSVTSMGNMVFWNCSNLTSIYCYAENVIVAYDIFLDCPSDMIIYVPAQSVDAYKAVSPWNEYTILPMGEIVNHWTPDESLYANNMSVIGLIQIDGVNQNSTSLEIGAFCGEEVRGSQLVQYIPELDKYLVFLTIHGNDNGDDISFKLYDHQTEEILDLRSPENITFAVNGTFGSITSPYVLNFSNMVNITASVNPENAGIVSGAGEYAINDIATLTATANEGYQFINWTENGEIVSTDAEYSFIITSDRTLVANFELLTYNVTASANPAEGGSINGAGIYTHGETATLNATANEGYQFINWTENDEVVSEDAEYSFTVTSDRTLVANFELLTYNVTASVNPAEGGSINGAGTYTHGETATLTATANEGFSFKNWTVDGNVVSTNSEYSFTVTEAKELVANFNCVQNRNLKSGWSWFSSYIEIEGEEGLEMMEDALGENGLQIKNQTAFVANSSAGWYGSLTSVSVESMYMIGTSAAQELTLSGDKVNPENHPITIGNNWKWISYLLSESIDVEDALSTINPNHGDYIKSHTLFSQYYDGIGWLGALNTMNPGEGYMYQNTSGTTKTLVYPTSASKGTRANVTSENNHWMADAGKYANNMSLIAYVKDNSEMDYEIGAFAGEELRGSARPIYIEALDRHMVFMTIYGEANEEITFKYYDVNNAEEEIVFTKENVIFSSNATYGSVDNPVAMMFGTEGLDENSSREFNIYPNPAKVNSEINLGMTYDRVEVYNAIGVKVAEYSNVNKLNGIENAGVYVIRIMNDNEIGNYRVVVE